MAKRKGYEPLYMLARSTVTLQGLPRDHVATVDVNDPAIQMRLRSTALVLLPADEQPKIGFDPVTLEPILEEDDA